MPERIVVWLRVAGRLQSLVTSPLGVDASATGLAPAGAWRKFIPQRARTWPFGRHHAHGPFKVMRHIELGSDARPHGARSITQISGSKASRCCRRPSLGCWHTLWRQTLHAFQRGTSSRPTARMPGVALAPRAL